MKSKHKPLCIGFTILELLITIAIIGILAAVAVPSYQAYTKRAYFSELVSATSAYKLGVSDCYMSTQDLNTCNGNENGVPRNLDDPVAGIASIKVAKGVITAVPVAMHGFTAADDYVLSPEVVHNHLTWAISGGAKDAGYVR